MLFYIKVKCKTFSIPEIKQDHHEDVSYTYKITK